MLTPEKIQELAEPIEGIYIAMANQLMVNIARHITSPTWTHTAKWEIQKLAELGQLTRENSAIINRWIKRIPPAVRETMEATRSAALDRIERELEKAARGETVTPPPRPSTLDAFADLADNAADRYNLVNTNMLNSSVEMFTQAILDTAQSVQEAEEQQRKLQAQAAATQEAVNEAAAALISGTETRDTAMRRAITRIAEEGLTGFVDRAGRQWTPEAYVNMVTRTTAHNIAVQATRDRMIEAGAHVFQYSSHAGARPLCYPIQGKFFSWTAATPGTVTDARGNVYRYEPFNAAYVEGYGTPAGPFGINCRHQPIPFYDGISIPSVRPGDIPDQETNDRQYQESQQQRALEREVRRCKRVVEMLGDKATQADLDAVKEAQKELAAFCKETGRTRRPDREKIY